MAFKPPPALLTKLLKFKALEHKDGRFLVWGIPAIISQAYTFVYLQKFLEKIMGKKEMMETLYSMGKFQSHQGFKMITDRFGYAKSIPDKVKLLDFNLGQADLIGLGKVSIIRADFIKKHFILDVDSVIAKEYKRFFGTQKECIDHYFRGSAAAFIEELIGEEVLALETSCIAKGKQSCQLVIKRIKDWDKKDPIYKEQFVKGYKTMKELGAKLEPYLITNYATSK